MWKSFAGGFLYAVLCTTYAIAANCPGNPHTLTNGTTADATQVMDNLNNLLNCANNNLAPVANPSFSGNVGIGTTTPGSALTVAGGISYDGVANSYTYSAVSWTEGDLLIGEWNAPAGSRIKIELAGEGPFNSINQSGMAVIYGQINNDYNLNASWYTIGGGPYEWILEGVKIEKVTDTDFKIYVSHGPYASYAVSASISSGTFTPSNTVASPASFTAATNNLILNAHHGFVGVQNTQPAYVLDVGTADVSGVVARFNNSTGSCTINPTTTSLSCSSDRRLKTDIGKIDPNAALSKIERLSPILFHWKKEAHNVSEHGGFIAQDVATIFPDLVSNDGYYSLNYAGFAPYLTAGLQALDKRTSWIGTVSSTPDRAMPSSILIYDAKTQSIGIGTAAPTTKLQVAGSARFGTKNAAGCLEDFHGTAIAGTCSSDARLKTILGPVTDVLSRLTRLDLVHFKWNETAAAIYHDSTKPINAGFVAQSVEKLFPELVSTDTHGYRQVNYTGLQLYGLEAIKELKVENDRQAQEIVTLKQAAAKLERQVVTAKAQNMQLKAADVTRENEVKRLRSQVANVNDRLDRLAAKFGSHEARGQSVDGSRLSAQKRVKWIKSAGVGTPAGVSTAAR